MVAWDYGEQTKMKKALIGVLLLSCLAGCQSMDRKGLIAAGYTQEYADGYVDGYSAGCSAVGHPFYEYKRDLSRYEQDRQYTKGWQDGFTIARCDYAAVW